MAIIYLLSWWYGQGWLQAFAQIKHRIDFIFDELSLKVLLRTLFEPWKQITSYAPSDATFGDKFRIWFDNLFARLIGFVIRTIMIGLAMLSAFIIFIIGILIAAVWPFIPLLPLVLIYMGFSQ